MAKKQSDDLNPPLHHLAIIMDGNGRWAKKKHLPRLRGHQEGAKRVLEIAKTCKEMAIPYLSLFAFSTENWRRSKQEVNGLFTLMNTFVKSYLKTLHEDKVRLMISGNLEGIPSESRTLLQQAIQETQNYTKYTLNICVNYGSQDEIVRASKKAYVAIQAGKMRLEDLTPDSFPQFLDTGSIPPVDALIRTSGEQRLSNFLLYQAAYSELIFVETYWPDFTSAKLKQALKVYQSRQRRFGAV